MSRKIKKRQRLDEIPLEHNDGSRYYLTRKGIYSYCYVHSLPKFDEKGLEHIRKEFFCSKRHNGRYLSETLNFRVIENRVSGIRINYRGYKHYAEEQDRREQEYAEKQEEKWLKQMEEEQERERRDREAEEHLTEIH